MKRTTIALALVGLPSAAGPAAAKPTYYSGRTDGGQPMAFQRSGNTVSGLRGTIPTTCVPARGGTPLAGAELFRPPGAFRIGRTQKAQALQDAALHYADVTKNYRVSLKRTKRGGFEARLHVNLSFNTVGYDSWGPFLQGWICQGDDSFTATR